jgi:hypothetical protein
MSEHDAHDEQADHLEHELEDMEDRNQRLVGAIENARKDWEAKKQDPDVPGAAGNPERAEGDPPPEQQYPAKGD